jgi:predicted DNA-binding transcriptional regulator AlpA
MDLKREIFNEKEVREEFGLTVPWLRKQRRLGNGPTYLKIGKMVRYRRSDVEVYLAGHAVEPREPRQ